MLAIFIGLPIILITLGTIGGIIGFVIGLIYGWKEFFGREGLIATIFASMIFSVGGAAMGVIFGGVIATLICGLQIIF